MSRTGKDYRNLLRSLFPPGKIWPIREESVLMKVLYGLGEELARIDSRALELIDESHVTLTDELLTEHEADYDITDPEKTDAKRREVLHQKLLTVGQQNKEYFEELSDALGYDITIDEYSPMWCDVGVCGDPVGDQYNLFYWTILIDADSVTVPSEVNLTSLIDGTYKFRPAHTVIDWDFTGIEFGLGFNQAFDSKPSWDNSYGLDNKELDFSRDFDNSFTNAYDYDGRNYIGGYNKAFEISFNRYSGGSFDFSEFSTDFKNPS